MQGCRPVAESEVVLAFLRGELESERFGSGVRRALIDAGGIELVQSPDLLRRRECGARARPLYGEGVARQGDF